MGLVQGHLQRRHPVLPDRPWCHRVQLHLPNLPSHPRRQHDRPVEVRVHAQLVSLRQIFICSSYNSGLLLVRTQLSFLLTDK